MMLNITVTAAPDFPQPTAVRDQSIVLTAENVEDILSGKLPERWQIFLEAALPEMVRDTIRQAEGGSQ